MADRPIIFSTPMVAALLDGRKSMTRRIIKPQPVERAKFGGIERDGTALFTVGCSYGKCRLPYAPGDRLWVREAWRTTRAYDDLRPSKLGGEEPVKYEADGSKQMWGWPDRFIPGRYRHARHMPRWASRLTLTVTQVRVQRLQDISEADAVAEGLYRLEPTAEDHEWKRRFDAENGYDSGPLTGVWMAPGVRQGWGRDKAERNRDRWGPTPRFCFELIWNSINGPDAWGANPWVAAVTFTVECRNIDEPPHD